MSKKRPICSPRYPYHVVNRGNNRESFRLSSEEMWKIFAHSAFEIHLIEDVQIHALVLMPNHFHLLLTTPRENLGSAMRRFLSSVTKEHNRISGRRGHLFGGAYKGTLVDSPRYYAHVLKYIYRNPVKAGLSQRVEDYPFSTLHGLLGNGHLPIPLFHPLRGAGDELIPESIDKVVEWLNAPVPQSDDHRIGKGLRKRHFALPKCRIRRCQIPLESELPKVPRGFLV